MRRIAFSILFIIKFCYNFLFFFLFFYINTKYKKLYIKFVLSQSLDDLLCIGLACDLIRCRTDAECPPFHTCTGVNNGGVGGGSGIVGGGVGIGSGGLARRTFRGSGGLLGAGSAGMDGMMDGMWSVVAPEIKRPLANLSIRNHCVSTGINTSNSIFYPGGNPIRIPSSSFTDPEPSSAENAIITSVKTSNSILRNNKSAQNLMNNFPNVKTNYFNSHGRGYSNNMNINDGNSNIIKPVLNAFEKQDMVNNASSLSNLSLKENMQNFNNKNVTSTSLSLPLSSNISNTPKNLPSSSSSPLKKAVVRFDGRFADYELAKNDEGDHILTTKDINDEKIIDKVKKEVGQEVKTENEDKTKNGDEVLKTFIFLQNENSIFNSQNARNIDKNIYNKILYGAGKKEEKYNNGALQTETNSSFLKNSNFTADQSNLKINQDENADKTLNLVNEKNAAILESEKNIVLYSSSPKIFTSVTFFPNENNVSVNTEPLHVSNRSEIELMQKENRNTRIDEKIEEKIEKKVREKAEEKEEIEGQQTFMSIVNSISGVLINCNNPVYEAFVGEDFSVNLRSKNTEENVYKNDLFSVYISSGKSSAPPFISVRSIDKNNIKNLNNYHMPSSSSIGSEVHIVCVEPGRFTLKFLVTVSFGFPTTVSNELCIAQTVCNTEGLSYIQKNPEVGIRSTFSSSILDVDEKDDIFRNNLDSSLSVSSLPSLAVSSSIPHTSSSISSPFQSIYPQLSSNVLDLPVRTNRSSSFFSLSSESEMSSFAPQSNSLEMKNKESKLKQVNGSPDVSGSFSSLSIKDKFVLDNKAVKKEDNIFLNTNKKIGNNVAPAVSKESKENNMVIVNHRQKPVNDEKNKNLIEKEIDQKESSFLSEINEKLNQPPIIECQRRNFKGKIGETVEFNILSFSQVDKERNFVSNNTFDAETVASLNDIDSSYVKAQVEEMGNDVENRHIVTFYGNNTNNYYVDTNEISKPDPKSMMRFVFYCDKESTDKKHYFIVAVDDFNNIATKLCEVNIECVPNHPPVAQCKNKDSTALVKTAFIGETISIDTSSIDNDLFYITDEDSHVNYLSAGLQLAPNMQIIFSLRKVCNEQFAEHKHIVITPYDNEDEGDPVTCSVMFICKDLNMQVDI